ncbi:ABC transporter substrate-binding protein [Propionivibrio dicarboxylicus]|uniref:Amino acid ABC transporter substrate-binding protein, PAAT family (TC 3.A.1.3.-) n=1 Tax=Propionivibrio dicarboxylicus TaxID=83767 RepID=A0A1G8JGV8_9RHOO|nr:ABC transporter substrate-binding protein [Propionivibrio dicarboxylicus]SDI30519.1 amino acid ABC transporter substrate-binding protein, PAAT family (TC 3.A.1.3.-) [Propionivibrio dicarboxylicus]
MSVSDALRQQLAPRGRLRASINLGNPVLARRDAPDAAPHGVSIDLAGALAERLGVGLDFVVFDSASQSVDAVADDRADIGFFAIDPKRGETIAFTDAYLHIEGWYAVRQDSPITASTEVDRPGLRVAVGRGSAYDLFLTRELHHAEIIRAPNPQAVTPLFVEQGLDVAAGVKQQLEMDMRQIPGLRLLPERFMVIRQAMGLAQNRGPDARAFLAAFVESLKADGFVADALRRHGIGGATVAPPACTF